MLEDLKLSFWIAVGQILESGAAIETRRCCANSLTPNGALERPGF